MIQVTKKEIIDAIGELPVDEYVKKDVFALSTGDECQHEYTEENCKRLSIPFVPTFVDIDCRFTDWDNNKKMYHGNDDIRVQGYIPLTDASGNSCLEQMSINELTNIYLLILGQDIVMSKMSDGVDDVSAAIVFGNEPGDYMSGDNFSKRDVYIETMRRAKELNIIK